MADFPGSIFVPRTTQNQPGISYDAAKSKIQFAEDYSLPAAEIAAIETILGVNPQGAYTTVKDWLTALASSGGSTLASEVPSGTVDDSNQTFTPVHTPLYIVVNGSQYAAGEGLYSSFSSGNINLSSPVGAGGFIRAYYNT